MRTLTLRLSGVSDGLVSKLDPGEKSSILECHGRSMNAADVSRNFSFCVGAAKQF